MLTGLYLILNTMCLTICFHYLIEKNFSIYSLLIIIVNLLMIISFFVKEIKKCRN